MDLISLYELNGIGIKELLEHDPRPTLIYDLDPDELHGTIARHDVKPLFCNEALRSHAILFDVIVGDGDDSTSSPSEDAARTKFKAWSVSITTFDDSKDVFPLMYFYQGILWTGSTVRKRWRLISGNQCFKIPDNVGAGSSNDAPEDTLLGGFASEQTSRSPTTRYPVAGLQSFLAQYSHEDTKDTSTIAVGSDRPQVRQKSEPISTRSSNFSGRNAAALVLASPEHATPDWTVVNPSGNLSPHILMARSVDWASTSLGTLSSWSCELRQAANIVMYNPHPAALFWGSDLTMLYNEAYRDEVAGNKHPALLGTGFDGPFQETWDLVGPLFAECARTGKSVRRENDTIPIERFGYLEETFFSWSFTPLYGGTNKILGFYNAPFETTSHCIAQRRLYTLQVLSQKVALARTIKEFWQCILAGLEDNHFDVPFALLYSVADSDDITDEISVSSGSTMSTKSCIFEGSLGVPDGHPAAPHRLDLKRSREGFIPSFREAMRTREPTKLQVQDGTLPEELLEGLHWRGFGEPCKEAIIFPLRPTNGDNILSFLLLGVNPRRAYDNDYKAFTTLLNRHLATGLASVVLFEEEMKRSQIAMVAAALEQEHLNEQLAVQTNRLQRMTTLSPLGMFYIDSKGLILEANDRYYEMTSQSRDTLTEMGWMDQLVEGSKQTMEDGWRKLTTDLVPWSAELQLNKKWVDPANPNAEPIDYWVLANSQPELGPDGTLRSVMGSITDISHLKWGQGLQDRRLLEAEETRRQQNEFIDITSHEMRNPLSAILQCADDIIATMHDCRGTAPSSIAPQIESCLESASTIALCVQHQKSIVDDILTVSKLDSNLLVLTAIPAQPVLVMTRVLKMFKSELLAKKITLECQIDPSFEKLGVDWVSMDPSRMSQIVINFMTNAIKFTSEQTERRIVVAMGVSLTAPKRTNTANFDYIPRKSNLSSSALNNDWNSGESLYIRVKVQDTGCGLSLEEKQVLFQKFQQASPRTHAQYGGSGLGLFISRQLTELHGGQIGVASEAGAGSTFGFFIRTRRCAAPTDFTIPLSNGIGTSIKSGPINGGGSLASMASKRPLVSRLPSARNAKEFSPEDLSILVVEDNLVNQKVLMKQLLKAGCMVNVADDGQKALDFIETTEFRKSAGSKLSVVLMDLEMPVMDGLTCVRHIRQMERTGEILKHLPVVAVTANVRHEQVEAARGAGMDDVVSKPFRIPDLLAKLNVLLGTLDRT